MLTLEAFFPLVFPAITEGLTSNAIAAYDRAWRLRILPTLGHLPLDQIDGLTIVNARKRWTGAPSTKVDATSLLSRILKWAVYLHHIPGNPLREIPKARKKTEDADPQARALSDAQTAEMLRLTEFHPHGQRSLAGLVYTGLRLGELVGLRWDDIDRFSGIITVRRTVSPNGSGKLELRSTKSGRIRSVPIVDALIPWLEPPADTPRYDHVFTGARGGFFDSTNLARSVRWSEIRDGIRTFPPGEPALHFHDLRHTALTRWSRLGATPQQLQAVAGHASVTTTELYTRTTGNAAANAIASLERNNRDLTNSGEVSGGNVQLIRAL